MFRDFPRDLADPPSVNVIMHLRNPLSYISSIIVGTSHDTTVFVVMRCPWLNSGRVAHALKLSARPIQWVPRPCVLGKGGYGDAGGGEATARDRETKSRAIRRCPYQPGLVEKIPPSIAKSHCTRPHRTRPCKKRKDGAPSAQMAQRRNPRSKGGPPAQSQPVPADPSKGQGQPNASWDLNGHWDVKTGNKGETVRVLPDGTRVDHDNNPIPMSSSSGSGVVNFVREHPVAVGVGLVVVGGAAILFTGGGAGPAVGALAFAF